MPSELPIPLSFSSSFSSNLSIHTRTFNASWWTDKRSQIALVDGIKLQSCSATSLSRALWKIGLQTGASAGPLYRQVYLYNSLSLSFSSCHYQVSGCLQSPMLQLTVARRLVVGAAPHLNRLKHHTSAEARGHHQTGIATGSGGATAAAVALPLQHGKQQQQQQQMSQREIQLKEFRKFYEVITNTREAKQLPPTPLGHAGSERILNNTLLHESPWQASCVELRERPVHAEERVISYGGIDFAALRRSHRRDGRQCSAGRFSHVEEDLPPPPSGEAMEGPGIDVVHYYETSTSEGLAGYQQVAMQVRKGLLPGTCTNYSAEGGFGVWVVPHETYAEMLRKTVAIGE